MSADTCCARAASGRVIAKTAVALTKSRRRIASPKALEMGDVPKAITAGTYDRRNGVRGSFCGAAIERPRRSKWVKSVVLGGRADVRYSPRKRPQKPTWRADRDGRPS